MLNTSCEFRFDDVTVASVINIIDGYIAIESIVQEQHSVIRFLWPKGVSSNAVHTEINPI